VAKVLLKKVYRCDPYKNEECRKDCLLNNSECRATTKKEYAIIDWRTGKPILLPGFYMLGIDLSDVFEEE
jgi:hypothetical protein